MPNIAITNYCNLTCSYCFANQFKEQQNKHNITFDELNQILNFLSHSNIFNQRIGIIGGEPTLHPELSNILNILINFCEKQKIPYPILFTNGIELSKYLKFFSKIYALININEPSTLTQQQQQQIQYNLSILNQLNLLNHITLGINLYPNIKDIEYIFKLAQQYNLSEIRCSYTAPNCQIMKNDKNNYYLEGKFIFLKFITLAQQYNIKVNLDCNKIPLCYFNTNEQNIILQQCNNLMYYCKPTIDILPNFTAISCFGLYNPIDLSIFNNLEEVEHYMYFQEIYPKTIKNSLIQCKTCSKFQNFSCQGGCLSFNE